MGQACLAGPQHIAKFSLDTHYLIPCYKQVKAVGGSKLTSHEWLSITFWIEKNTTKQPVYICDKVDRIYFGKKGRVDVNILSQVFPFPMHSSSQTIPSVAIINQSVSKHTTSQATRACPPPRPETLPHPPLEENIPKLEQYLRGKFRGTAFNRTAPFPAMFMPPAHIHLNETAKPYASHTFIPIPFHWKKEVKESLDRDVERGIIAPVPIGTPVEWCSPMIVRAKKNGKPRTTIDLQHLNSQCSRETHHCQSPFLAACQVPPDTKKTILDAVDGYHAIELDAERQPLTTFITEWGRYLYLRLPHRYLAAGDAYTRRYDGVIKDLPQKVKIVDDTLLYDYSIKEAFFHTWDYLTTCAENGIIISKEKFKFAETL